MAEVVAAAADEALVAAAVVYAHEHQVLVLVACYGAGEGLEDSVVG